MSENKNNNNLFSDIDLTSNDFLDPTESTPFDSIFTQPIANDPFANASTSPSPFDNVDPTPNEEPAPVVPVKETKPEEKPEEKAPVVPIKKEETKSKKAKKGKADPALSKSIKDQKKARENMKVDTTWNIAYAARQYNPPEDDMTLEQVRQWLEIDYPELSKERCRLEIDNEKKLIVPIVNGAKKG